MRRVVKKVQHIRTTCESGGNTSKAMDKPRDKIHTPLLRPQTARTMIVYNDRNPASREQPYSVVFDEATTSRLRAFLRRSRFLGDRRRAARVVPWPSHGLSRIHPPTAFSKSLNPDDLPSQKCSNTKRKSWHIAGGSAQRNPLMRRQTQGE